jgi:hypothetical protein
MFRLIVGAEGGRMFRTRTVALSLIVGILLVLLAWLVVRGLEHQARKDAVDRLGALRPGIARGIEQRATGQAFVAAAIADSPLSVALDVLDDFRSDMAAAVAGANKAAAGLPPREAIEQRQKYVSAFKRGGEPLVDVVVDRMADMIHDRWGDSRFSSDGRPGFMAAERARLVQCLSIDIRQCFWDYSYVTLLEVLGSVSKSWKLPVGHRVIVTDARGVGLADSENDKWSDSQEFAVSNELARLARSSGQPQRDLMLLDGTWHLATALPVVSGSRVVGTVVVADPFNRWMAKEDSDALGVPVIFTIGDKVVDTAAPPDVAKMLARATDSVPGWLAVAFQLPGVPQGRDFRIIATTDIAKRLEQFANARLLLLALGLLIAIGGALCLFWVVLRYDRDIESLYQGVHEIISGNFDYTFPVDQKDDILRNLGNTLNLMGMVIQGRSTDVDESGPDAWTGKKSWESVDFAADTVEKSIEAESTEADFESGNFDVAALASLPAETYYKNLFAEFMAARRAAGVADEGITQQTFMVRVVHLEQKMKKRFGVSMVRFVVSTKDGEVILIPVRIRG